MKGLWFGARCGLSENENREDVGVAAMAAELWCEVN